MEVDPTASRLVAWPQYSSAAKVLDPESKMSIVAIGTNEMLPILSYRLSPIAALAVPRCEHVFREGSACEPTLV